MQVLGVDPGSNATGWAVISRRSGGYLLHGAGVIRTRSEEPIGARLMVIHRGLMAVLTDYTPESAGIEAIFRYRSSESAIRLGQARGVALLALAQHGLVISEYNPMTVKKTVTGSGKADKAQIAQMVARLVTGGEGLASDASDAVAIAITHLAQSPLRALLQRNT